MAVKLDERILGLMRLRCHSKSSLIDLVNCGEKLNLRCWTKKPWPASVTYMRLRFSMLRKYIPKTLRCHQAIGMAANI